MNCKDLVINEHEYFQWLIASGKNRIRPTLGIISLALLGLCTRTVAETEEVVNGTLYLRWNEFFVTKRPPKISKIKSFILESTKEFLKYSPLTGRIIAMCLRKSEEDEKFRKAFEFLVPHAELANGKFTLERMFEIVEKETGLS